MTWEEMIADLPQECSLGVKTSSQGHQQYWRGFKLHWDVADADGGRIPLSCLLTGASVHDSQVAIPLRQMSAARVQWKCDLMDSAYDAKAIREQAQKLAQEAIIKPVQRKHKSPDAPDKLTERTEAALPKTHHRRATERALEGRVWWPSHLLPRGQQNHGSSAVRGGRTHRRSVAPSRHLARAALSLLLSHRTAHSGREECARPLPRPHPSRSLLASLAVSSRSGRPHRREMCLLSRHRESVTIVGSISWTHDANALLETQAEK